MRWWNHHRANICFLCFTYITVGAYSTGKVSWRPLTYAFQFFNQLQSATPARLSAISLPSELNYTVLAGATQYGAPGPSMTGILISALSSVTDGYNVTLGATPLTTWQRATRIIDATRNGTLIENVTVVASASGALECGQTIGAPFVAYVTFTQVV